MERIKILFKNTDKKTMSNLVTGLLLGILLLIVSNTLLKNPDKDNISNFKRNSVANISENSNTYSEKSYEEILETRLENSLSLIEGVGKVKVMLTISNGKELMVAKNSISDDSNTKESDTGGGSREVLSKKVDEKIIIISSSNGEEKALVLKEIEPKIEGIIVIAEGGNDIIIKESLIKSVQSVLDVEAHKISILKMK